MTSEVRTTVTSRGRSGARRAFRPVLVATLMLAAGGACRFVTTDIGSIRAKPGEYLTREVTVVGDVTDSVKLPFLPGLYGVKDGTGEMHVITNVQPPLTATRVRIRVRVESAATIDGQAVGLHLKELERY